MLYTACTAHHRDDPGRRCGRTDICALVVTATFDQGGRPVVHHVHRVCADCREWMGLPHGDGMLTPAGQIPIDDDGTIPEPEVL